MPYGSLTLVEVDDSLEVVLSSLRTQKYVTYAAAALVTYDYILTFRQEIDTVWRRRISVISILLILNRWCVLVSTLLMLVPASPETCKYVPTLASAIELVGLTTPAVIEALRICAIWRQNWFLFVLVLLPGLLPTPTVAVLMARLQRGYAGPPLNICTVTFDEATARLFPILDPLTSVGCLCLQILAVSLTWAKTYQHWYGARNLRLPLVLSTSLLRDGTLYFLSVLAISIVQIFVYVKNWENYALLVNVLPPILVSRFLFSLRQLGRRKDTLSYSGPGIAFSLPNYLTTIDVFGNIGESVVVQAEADMDKDGEAHNMVPLGTA